VVNNGVLIGQQTRKLPQKVSLIEETTTNRVAETTWMAKEASGFAGSEGVVRTTNPSMPHAAGRTFATNPLQRSRKKLPYSMDNRIFSAYDNNKDVKGVQGLEFMHLRNHPLLPNTDESLDGYDASPASALPVAPSNARVPAQDDVIKQDLAVLSRS
jgi:hypothetical protein